jgi:hypothetical protein
MHAAKSVHGQHSNDKISGRYGSKTVLRTMSLAMNLLEYQAVPRQTCFRYPHMQADGSDVSTKVKLQPHCVMTGSEHGCVVARQTRYRAGGVDSHVRVV